MAKSGRELQTDTYVTEENGGVVCLPAGTKEGDIDKELLKKIDNESAWGDSGEEIDKETGDPVVVHDYSGKSPADLMKMVDERGLTPASNKKADLVEALEQSDLTVSNVETGEVP